MHARCLLKCRHEEEQVMETDATQVEHRVHALNIQLLPGLCIACMICTHTNSDLHNASPSGLSLFSYSVCPLMWRSCLVVDLEAPTGHVYTCAHTSMQHQHDLSAGEIASLQLLVSPAAGALTVHSSAGGLSCLHAAMPVPAGWLRSAASSWRFSAGRCRATWIKAT